MEILKQLSSQQGDKTEASNKRVAEKCINAPELLSEISMGFDATDKKLQSDCIEVFTEVSESHPALIVPYVEKVLPLLSEKATKTRWEAVHTLSYVADQVPEVIGSVLIELEDLIERDKSMIVRDYSVDTIANYAQVNKDTAQRSFPLLKRILAIWGEKHAKQVLKGFSNILDKDPSYGKEIVKLTEPYLSAKKKVVVNAATKLIKKAEA